MNLSRVVRLLKLLAMLQAGKGSTVEGLAQECGVARRTIFRDIEVLRAAGLPVVYDADRRRHHIPGTHFLPPTNFTAEEALALIVLCGELGQGSQLPFFGPAQSAAMKLASSLPARLREQVLEMADRVEIRTGPTNPLERQRPFYEQLLQAVTRRLYVRIQYHSLAEGGVIHTRLAPYRLLFSRRSWYAIGRSSLHRENRTFNVGRILELDLLEDHFKVPRGFSIQRYLRNAWHLIPEPGPDSHVVVRFSRMVAENVAEVRWHKTQQCHFRDDGTVDFHVTVSGLHEISWWILGYGDQAEVLKPPKLRRLIAERAAKMAGKYREEQ